MNKIDLQFTGTIINTSPIHIVPPNSTTVQIEGGKAGEIATLPVVIDGAVQKVPVIPATSIRGKLRRAATAVALAKLPGKPSLDAWLYATLGGVKGSEDESVFDLTDRNARRANFPITGLFGASAPWDPSHAFIGAAIPQSPVQPEFVTGVRSDDFSRRADIVDLLDANAVPEYLTLRQGTKERAAITQELQAAKNDRAKLNKLGDIDAAAKKSAQINELLEKEKKAKKAAGNSVQMPIAHRVLPIGVTMNHRMILKGVTPIEAGLFIEALSYLFNDDPFIGGKLSLGYGAIDAEWAVSMRPYKGQQWKELGHVSGTSLSPLNNSIPELLLLVEQWNSFAESGEFSLKSYKELTA